MYLFKKLFFAIVVFFYVLYFSIEAKAEKKISILMFSSEIRYIEAVKGITDTLKKTGFEEPNVKITIENAEANKAKAAEIVSKLASAKMDLIFTIGTHATLATTLEIKDVPVVFAQVYDPVEAGIAKDWKSSGNNTTGSTTKIPMSKIFDELKQFAAVKKMAVLYTHGEKNSESQLKDINGVQSSYGIKIIPVSLSKTEEIIQSLPIVMQSADAIYVTGSNFVNSQLSKIMEMAIKKKVITVTHLNDLVEKGVLLGVCPNAYQVGCLAGEKAVAILNGASPSTIPIETLKEFEVVLNIKTAKAGNFQISPDFKKRVTKTIE